MASNELKSDESKSFKRKKETEMQDLESPQCSSLTRQQPSAPSDSSQVGDVEKVTQDLSREITLLLAKYAKILRERSSVDASYVQEFDEILKEARAVEIQLKQKRESLKNRLTMIANTLQR
ncbi:hypothetical protein FKM82_014016 [Ascaphus truei]|uniref:testis-expressed protein 12 n=1 Tax=Ascaphus truei TaxID=8439 RepID=UPI003F5A9350